ncbi:hypothetical protein DZJ_00720 [Dickeya ananatis]
MNKHLYLMMILGVSSTVTAAEQTTQAENTATDKPATAEKKTSRGRYDSGAFHAHQPEYGNANY